MEQVQEHTEVLADLAGDPALLSGPQRVALVGRVQKMRSWVDARESELLAVVRCERDDVDTGARDLSQLCQQRANVGYGEAKRRELRATWLQELPAVGTALAAGRLGTPLADEICLLAERLAPEHRPTLAARLDALIDEIAELTPVRARKHLRAFEDGLDDDDGKARLERHRRANAFRMPKRPDGTVGLGGQLDRGSAEYLRTAIDVKVTELWRLEGRGRNDFEPPEHVRTNEQRRAAALVALVRAGAAVDPATRGRAEIIVLMDHQTLLGQLSAHPIAKLASGDQMPAAEARRLACDADIIPIVLGGPSRPLDVGRKARLATSSQRAALRAGHETCCVGGCDVPFDHCEIHHITWWRHGGRSDIDNLAPVCSKHHHLIHDDGWELSLDADRVGRLQRSPAAASAATPPNARPRAHVGPGHDPSRSRPGQRPRRTNPPAAPPPTDHVRPTRC